MGVYSREVTAGNYAENVAAHAALGCVSSRVAGGSCGSGAMSGAIGLAIGDRLNVAGDDFAALAENVAIHSLVGGLSSRLAGGSVSTGAETAAFAYLFSGAAHAYESGGTDGLLDFAGKIWNLPNTAIGLVYGSVGYAVGWGMYAKGWQDLPPDVIVGNNAIQFTNNPFARLGAITLGNVEVFGGSPSDMGADGNVMGIHEMQQTYQGQLLGPLYIASNILGGLAGLVFGGDWYAPQNWNEVGPQQHPPKLW